MACNSNKKTDLGEDLRKQHEENLRKFDSMHSGELTKEQKRERDNLAGFAGKAPVFYQTDSAQNVITPLPDSISEKMQKSAVPDKRKQ